MAGSDLELSRQKHEQNFLSLT